MALARRTGQFNAGAQAHGVRISDMVAAGRLLRALRAAGEGRRAVVQVALHNLSLCKLAKLLRVRGERARALLLQGLDALDGHFNPAVTGPERQRMRAGHPNFN